jgi:hypothetical protein
MTLRGVYESLQKLKNNPLKHEITYNEKDSRKTEMVYWYEEIKSINPPLNIKKLNPEIEKLFNEVYFKIRDLDEKAEKLLEGLTKLNYLGRNIKTSYFNELDNYKNNERLKLGLKNLKKKINNLKCYKW